MRNKSAGEEVKELIISFGKSYKPVPQDTILRWIKSELADAGVYTCFQSY